LNFNDVDKTNECGGRAYEFLQRSVTLLDAIERIMHPRFPLKSLLTRGSISAGRGFWSGADVRYLPYQ